MTLSTHQDLCAAQVRQISRDLAPEIADLPRLSIVVERFLLQAGRDTATTAEIAAALKFDPILEAWVLRQANSGFCKLSRPIRTVADACVVLGIGPVTRLVYAACTRDLLRRRLRCYHYPGNGFWLHGLAVGLASRRLAELLGESSPIDAEASLVAGLLHDVGKLLLDERLPRAGGSRNVDLSEERECAGFDHGMHSAAVAVTWLLPFDVVAAIALHHSDHPPPQARLVSLADMLMTHWEIGTAVYPRLDRDPPWKQLMDAAISLGARERQIQQWCEGLAPLISGLAEMINAVGHGRPPDIPTKEARDSNAKINRAPSRRHAREGQKRTRERRRARWKG